MTARLRWLLAALAALLVLGCGKPEVRNPVQPSPFREPTDGGFLAGTALVDITPPLHLSLFGHGPEGRVATGVRLRLHCQVFVVSTGKEPIALVPCDLQSPSAALQRGVAARLSYYGIPITADRVFIMATHTHAGPAHYFDAPGYSGPFSSSIPGYDEKVKDFLANAVAEGIVRAFAAQRPACVGWNEVNLTGLAFNRSYVPFLANDTDGNYVAPILEQAHAADRGYGQASAAVAPGAGHAESSQASLATGAERAVDPRLFVMRFDARAAGSTTCDAAGPPLGVLAVYGVHPTGVANTNQLYHGDIFGFATRVATACLSDAKPVGHGGALSFADTECDATLTVRDDNVLVGLANGVEGDVSPNVQFQSVPNARRLGRRLGVEIARAAAAIQTLDAAGPFEHAYWELWFPSGRYDDSGHELCEVAELGIAAGGGARDGPTRLRVLDAANPGFRLKLPDGMKEEDRPCQGYKLPLRLGTAPDPQKFPSYGALGFVRVGRARFATVPAELTTVTGLRIRQILTSGLGTSSIALVGLTNQYLQYVTTKEEYDFQYYEGASNLYGPHTAEFIARHVDCLAGWVTRNRESGRPAADRWVKERCPQPLKVNELSRFEPHPKPVVSRMPEEEDLALLALDAPEVQPTFEDGAPGWEMTFPRLPITFTADRGKYRVVVLAGQRGNVVEDDDDGASIETQELLDEQRWRVRWAPELDAGDDICDQWFRLAVRGRFELESKPFKPDCARARRGLP